MPRKKLIVNKIPLSPQDKIDRNPHFKRTPRLYLELIENKDKIKQNLVNTEYEPENGNSDTEYEKSDSGSVEYKMRTPVFESNKKFDSDDDDFKSTGYKTDDELRSDDSDNEKSEQKYSQRSKSNYDSDEEYPQERNTFKEDDFNKSRDTYKSDNTDDSDLSDRLKKILEDEPRSEKYNRRDKNREEIRDDYENRGRDRDYGRDYDNQSDYSSVDSHADYTKYSAKRSAHNYYKNSPRHKAPTLAELENKGEIRTNDYLPEASRTAQNEIDEEDLKREMLFKFELLKKSYKDSSVEIPEFTIHSDYKTMEKGYENSLRRLSLDSTVDSYKTYMIYGFMGVEFLLGYLFKFDMQGFTQHQLSNMGSYERLLIELGEKSYVPGGSDWPVELRLFGLILMNAAFFLGSKMMMKKTGENVMGMVNSFNNLNRQENMTPKSRPRETSPPGGKPKMRGPDIDLEELDEEI